MSPHGRDSMTLAPGDEYPAGVLRMVFGAFRGRRYFRHPTDRCGGDGSGRLLIFGDVVYSVGHEAAGCDEETPRVHPRHRCRAASAITRSRSAMIEASGTMRRPPSSIRANDSIERSMSAASLLIGVGMSSIASAGAAAWSYPLNFGLATKATRERRGAISLSIASHFPTIPLSYCIMPVRWPPGRAELATKPGPTGSDTPTNTIGIACVSWRNAAAAGCRLQKDHVGLEPSQLFC